MSSSVINISARGDNNYDNVEIRKLKSLSPSHNAKIVQFLDENDNWRVLMSIVPKFLPDLTQDATNSSEQNVLHTDSEQKTHNAGVDLQTPKETWEKMYNTTHIKLIENASKRDARSPGEIFLFEWATTGRRRPTVVHFLELLKAANLYRAADYVAKEILRRGAVSRPNTGPAAKINLLELDEALEAEDNENPQVSNVTIENNLDNSKPENTLCGANAPKLLVQQKPPKVDGATGCKKNTVRIGQEHNRQIIPVQNLPEVQIIEPTTSIQFQGNQVTTQCKVENIVLQSPPESSDAVIPDFSGLIVNNQLDRNQHQSDDQSSDSDTSDSSDSSSIKITNSQGHNTMSNNVLFSNVRPNFSDLLNFNAPNPDFENNITSQTVGNALSSELTETKQNSNSCSGEIRPNISALLDGAVVTTSEPSLHLANNSGGQFLPDLSGLLGKSSLSDNNNSNEQITPCLSGLLHQTQNISTESNNLPSFSSLLQSNETKCFDDSSSSDDD